jgi:metal-dependent amidase/aminoacylase/carboxypeptidase family protein
LLETKKKPNDLKKSGKVMQITFDDAFTIIKENTILEYKIRERSKEKFGKIIAQVEEMSGKYAESKGIVRMLWFISIDLIQNVYKYGVFDQWLFTNNFMVSYSERVFVLMTQNIIKSSETESVKKGIDAINSCFTGENCIDLLNRKYKDKLQERPMPTEGASLGLIDVARKSENKLLYNFTPAGGNYSVFSIIVIVENK